MPPQTTQPEQQIPGSDVLFDTLNSSKLEDTQRRQIWDAYHVQGDENAFIKSMDTLPVDDNVKRTLYDMRFKGFKNQPTQAPPAAQATPQATPKASVPGESTISAAPLTWGESMVSAVTPPALEQAVRSSMPKIADVIWGEGALRRSGKRAEQAHALAQAPSGEYAKTARGQSWFEASQIPGLDTPGTKAHGAAEAASSMTAPDAWGYFALPESRAVAGAFALQGAYGLDQQTKLLRQLKNQRELVAAAKNPGYEDNLKEYDAQINEVEGGAGFDAAMMFLIGKHAAKNAPAPYTTPAIEAAIGARPRKLAGLPTGDPTSTPGTHAEVPNVLPEMSTPRPLEQRTGNLASDADVRQTESAPVKTGQAPVVNSIPTESFPAQGGGISVAGTEAAIKGTTPEDAAQALRVENSDLADRIKNGQIPEAGRPHVEQRIDENTKLITDIESKGMAPDAPTPPPDATDLTKLSLGELARKAMSDPAGRPKEKTEAWAEMKRREGQTKAPVAKTEQDKLVESMGLVPVGTGGGMTNFDHPDFRGISAALKTEDVTEDAVKTAMAGRLLAHAESQGTAPSVRSKMLSTVREMLESPEEARMGGPAPEKPTTLPGPPPTVKIPDVLSKDIVDLPNEVRKFREAQGTPTEAIAKSRYLTFKEGVRNNLAKFIGSLGTQRLKTLIEQANTEADRRERAADELQRVKDQTPWAQAMRAETSEGRPVRAREFESEQFNQAGQPVRAVDTLTKGIRDEYHAKLSDRTKTVPDLIDSAMRARAEASGVDVNAVEVADETAYKEAAKTERASLVKNFKGRLNEALQAEVENNPALVQEIGEEEATRNLQQKVLKALRKEELPSGETVEERLKALDEIIGRKPAKEVYAGKALPVENEGVVTHPGEVSEANLKLMKAIFKQELGRTIDRLPKPEEVDQAINDIRSHGQLQKLIASKASEQIKAIAGAKINEAGFAGDKKPASIVHVPIANKVAIAAHKLGYDVVTVGAETPGFDRAWLSPDGKTSIRVPLNEEHDSVIWKILGKPTGDSENVAPISTNAILKAGWIRKASYNAYQVDRWTPTKIEAADWDIICSNRYSKGLVLEQIDAHGHYQYFDIEPGWKDLKVEFAKTLRNKEGYELTDESGMAGVHKGAGHPSLPFGPLFHLTGMLTGATAGYHVGGELGALIGGGIGISIPEIGRVPALYRKAFAKVSPLLATSKIPLGEFFFGKKQMELNDPEMDPIIDKQNSDLRGGPPVNWLAKMSRLPGTMMQKFDPLFFANSNVTKLTSLLVSGDERGAAFRNLKGKIDFAESPYAIASTAIGGGSGPAEMHLLAYKDIFHEAEDARLLNHLQKYLNLKGGYARAWDVLQDNLHQADSEIENINQKLANGQLSTRERIALEDDLADANRNKKDIQTRMASGRVTPNPYTSPAKIQAALADMPNRLSPADYGRVKGLADRVFALNRTILDAAHTEGLVSDEGYQKFTARGNEYIPMHRILEDLSANEGNWHGKSPLYLRQQNVIKALTGSDLINRNPIVASADANLEAMKEITRNHVIKSFLDLAKNDPKGVGKLFKEVPSGYQAQSGEYIVGHYEGGKAKSYAVPDWLGSTLQHASPLANHMASNAMFRFFSKTFRMGVTMANPAWGLPNAARHLGDMLLMSQGGLDFSKPRTIPGDIVKLGKMWGESLKDTITKSPAFREYMKSMGAYTTFQRQLTPELYLDPNDLGHAPNWRTKVITKIADFNESMEHSTKLTTFKRLKEMGYTDQAAAFETRRYGGGPDFSRMGETSSVINQLMMFFNAHLQYESRVIKRVVENPAAMVPMLTAMTAIALSLNHHNWQQTLPNGKPAMQAVPYTDRENNFVVLTGGTYTTDNGTIAPNYYRIPKPSVLKFLYNPIENVVSKSIYDETREGSQVALDTLSSYLPAQVHIDKDHLVRSITSGVLGSLNPALSMPIEEALNYQPFGARPIVPVREQKALPSEQFGPTTPRVYKMMGQGGVKGAAAGATLGGSLGMMFGGPEGALLGGAVGAGTGELGFSPRRLQHIVSGTFGGVGQAVAGIGDIGKKSEVEFPFQGQQATRQIPGVGPLVSRFVGTPMNQTERDAETKFYADGNQAIQYVSTYQMLAKRDPQRATQFLTENLTQYRTGIIAQRIQKRVGEINQALISLQDQPGIPDDERIKALTNLHNTKTQIINIGISLMRSSTQSGSKTTQGAGAAIGANWAR